MSNPKQQEDVSAKEAQALQQLSDAVRALLIDEQPLDVRLQVMSAKSAEAQALLEQALTERLETQSAVDPTLGTNLLRTALAADLQCRHDHASKLLERAVSLLRKDDKLQEQAIPSIELLCNAGRVMSLDGRSDLAVNFQRRAMQIADSILDSGHPYTAQCHYDLAVTMDVQGNPEAEKLYEESLALQANHLGMSANLRKLAGAYLQFQNVAAAQRLYARALKLREVACGAEHIDLVPLLLTCGDLEGQVLDNHVREREFFERALKINEKETGPDSESSCSITVKIAMACMMCQDFKAAVTMYEHAMPIREKRLGGNNPEFIADLRCMALCLSLSGELEKARQLFERILVLHENSQPPNEIGLAEAAMHLSATYSQMKMYESAADLLTNLLPRSEKALGSDHPIIDKLKLILADAIARASG